MLMDLAVLKVPSDKTVRKQREGEKWETEKEGGLRCIRGGGAGGPAPDQNFEQNCHQVEPAGASKPTLGSLQEPWNHTAA